MGWTVRELDKWHTLEDAKREHVKRCAAYSGGYSGELIDYEWRPTTFYAIICVTKPDSSVETFLRTDMIDTSNNSFGYKDMSESMGPHVDNAPSAAFKRKIFQYIPIADGYAKGFRDKHGIQYSTEDKDLFGNMNAAIKPDLNQMKMDI